MLKKGAAEKGMTFNDDMQKEVDRTVETFSTYAKRPATPPALPEADVRQQHDHVHFKSI